MTGTPTPTVDGRHLVLRGDASASIGTGHLMRMLALGQAWLDAGGRAEVVVADAPDAILDRYAREGIGIQRLASAHPDPGDSGELVARLRADPDARIVVDGPIFDAPYLDALHMGASRVLVVDDMAALPRYPVALVLNQNAHAERSAYPALDGTAYLLGLPYTMLRREFRTPRPPRPVAAAARHVLLTFGGADPAGMTARTLRAIATLPGSVRDGLEVLAVVGAAAPDSARLETMAAASGLRVTVERDVTDMADRLAWADLTVMSGGSTVWEVARIGVPALVVETSPVERLSARGLEQVGLFDRLGPAAGLDDAALASAIAGRLDDVDWRTRMASLGPSLVDGQGAARVVAAVAGLDAR